MQIHAMQHDRFNVGNCYFAENAEDKAGLHRHLGHGTANA